MRNRRGQNMLEYAVLFSIVLSVLLIMQFYIRRAYSGHIKREADKVGPQYSPDHTESMILTNRDLNTVSFTGGQTDDSGLPGNLPAMIPGSTNVPDGMTVTYSDTTTDFNRWEAVDAFTAN